MKAIYEGPTAPDFVQRAYPQRNFPPHGVRGTLEGGEGNPVDQLVTYGFTPDQGQPWYFSGGWVCLVYLDDDEAPIGAPVIGDFRLLPEEIASE